MDVLDILDRLVAFQSVAGQPNADIAGWIETYLAERGAQVALLPGPEGDRSNLFATIGPADVPGYILSGHMDVVPAAEPQWSSPPFALRREGEHFYGRGTTDMKGFLAAALAAVPHLTGLRLARPIHLAFSYDEEVGCRGAPHLIARLSALCAKPLGVIVGEPSGMRAVRGHKGKAAARVIIHGRSGHSSRPDLGLNAIHAMAGVLGATVSEAERLTHGPFDPAFEPPYSSLQAGVIAGGQSVNIIPATCTLDLEARAIPGVDPASLLAPVRARAEACEANGFRIDWRPLSAYPALSLPQDAALAALLRELTGEAPLAAVSYGTEAGLYQAAGFDAIICGPGDIDRAHKPNEYILASELTACQRMIEALGARCSA
ncbi:acetylornithine deacetylase [Mesorhizobium sp. M1C.F.Ca.ET.193.01.1.1]|uniref:acetylornithine deacetylase n=3 Tax=Mesorhizobium TaxID=68287 RepID=UPI000FD298A2|nr:MULTISPECIES: acetylornithine deacetylase [unclassified Mesorhizobium]TGT00108.1 acetylornithine deacetylase [bacterium M00.F.Ca.ET.177.01.1.1]TGQ53503.1 acetylornithine deacetylase [Mesorhizobium sp. M1C.F.Ca.ET.210.01.1.1]TGQ70770.1 acetylornithine deacetylase [Mesorhizobium sp. M1C.F.Ca.ET.212.01.1.1]TGR07344.1 acetylornithine deacetylase [Mesorhizobium sp. M1C.F.Ca.ET.204.01.1.1]TGR28217.1 acetylornithine deacetylase [Mesorhizobium sp. M1C.F.Ca.ET.196.01.1.1]